MRFATWLRPALLALTLVGFLHGLEAEGYDSELTRETLRGLPGVYVLVERFTDPESRAGFSDAIFRTDVERKLRLAGIRMLTKEELSSTPGAPTLYLNVKPFHAQLGKSAYAISLALHQNARLEMNGERALGVCTWFTRSVGWGSLRDLRGDVRDDMDLFVNAWLSVNPRPAAAPTTP